MIKIVAADDHAIFREGLKNLFAGHSEYLLSAVAANGGEMLQMVDEYEPDLVIVDHEMPGMSGLDLVTQLRRRGQPCMIVVLTGIADESLLFDYEELGGEGIVLKQEDPDELIAAIKSIIAGDRHVSAPVQALIAKATNLEKLTSRERLVIRHIAQGLSAKEISQIMGVSPKTVDNHRTNLMQKLDLHNAAEVAAFASKSGLV